MLHVLLLAAARGRTKAAEDITAIIMCVCLTPVCKFQADPALPYTPSICPPGQTPSAADSPGPQLLTQPLSAPSGPRSRLAQPCRVSAQDSRPPAETLPESCSTEALGFQHLHKH